MKVLSAAIASLLAGSAVAFVGPSPRRSTSTRLFLEDRIAKMIDRELYRQNHKKEFENEWMEKNREVMMHHMHDTSSSLMMDDRVEEFQEHIKDVRMAANDPRRYCADRCLTTGNCDVYEDL
jgi:hypothetical protein